MAAYEQRLSADPEFALSQGGQYFEAKNDVHLVLKEIARKLDELNIPGDGKPKPVAFPDPQGHTVEFAGVKVIGLAEPVELKIASGISALHRGKDPVDVSELIRVLRLPREFADKLNLYVRQKFIELWQANEAAPQDEDTSIL